VKGRCPGPLDDGDGGGIRRRAGWRSREERRTLARPNSARQRTLNSSPAAEFRAVHSRPPPSRTSHGTRAASTSSIIDRIPPARPPGFGTAQPCPTARGTIGVIIGHVCHPPHGGSARRSRALRRDPRSSSLVACATRPPGGSARRSRALRRVATARANGFNRRPGPPPRGWGAACGLIICRPPVVHTLLPRRKSPK
jgi:hypothetical protein